jgi:predicted DNA-binding protein (MmcQ/YjbR family)
VRGKIFAGFGDHGGTESIGFKLEREHADAAIQDPRFTRAPYVGQHGWISMDVKGVRDWGEVRALVLESYRLIAPKALWQWRRARRPPGRRHRPGRGGPGRRGVRAVRARSVADPHGGERALTALPGAPPSRGRPLDRPANESQRLAHPLAFPPADAPSMELAEERGKLLGACSASSSSARWERCSSERTRNLLHLVPR